MTLSLFLFGHLIAFQFLQQPFQTNRQAGTKTNRQEMKRKDNCAHATQNVRTCSPKNKHTAYATSLNGLFGRLTRMCKLTRSFNITAECSGEENAVRRRDAVVDWWVLLQVPVYSWQGYHRWMDVLRAQIWCTVHGVGEFAGKVLVIYDKELMVPLNVRWKHPLMRGMSIILVGICSLSLHFRPERAIFRYPFLHQNAQIKTLFQTKWNTQNYK